MIDKNCWSIFISMVICVIALVYGKSFEMENMHRSGKVKVGLVPETTDENEINGKAPQENCFKHDYDHLGDDLSETPIHDVTDPKRCQELCLKEPRCNFFAVNLRDDPKENNGCWLKSGTGSSKNRDKVIFGPKSCNDNKLTSMMNKNAIDGMQKAIVDQIAKLVGSTSGLNFHTESNRETNTKNPLYELSKAVTDTEISPSTIRSAYGANIEHMEEVANDMENAIQANKNLQPHSKQASHVSPKAAVDFYTSTTVSRQRDVDSIENGSEMSTNDANSLDNDQLNSVMISKLVSGSQQNLNAEKIYINDDEGEGLKPSDGADQQRAKKSSMPCPRPDCDKDMDMDKDDSERSKRPSIPCPGPDCSIANNIDGHANDRSKRSPNICPGPDCNKRIDGDENEENRLLANPCPGPDCDVSFDGDQHKKYKMSPRVCPGPDCSLPIDGDDAERLKRSINPCPGPDCNVAKNSQNYENDRSKRSFAICPGPDCNMPIDGDNLAIIRSLNLCPGPDCNVNNDGDVHKRFKKSPNICPGPDCSLTILPSPDEDDNERIKQAVNPCPGPDCNVESNADFQDNERVKRSLVTCLGPDCTKNNALQEVANVEQSAILCPGPDCNVHIDEDDHERSKRSYKSCPGPDCSLNADADDRKRQQRPFNACPGPDCQNKPLLNPCPGPDCNKNDGDNFRKLVQNSEEEN